MPPWNKQPWQIAQKMGSNKTSLFFFTLTNLVWLLFRTGTKPSRVTYPCQRAAATNISISLGALVPLSITGVLAAALTKTKTIISRNKNIVLAVTMILVIGGGLAWNQSNNSSEEFQLVLESKAATLSPASDIFVVNGRATAHISELINLMGLHGLFFYQSSVVGQNQSPEGLIARDDVVLIKINSQWDQRGGTNTDVLKELIQAIIAHPDGFVGEIVIADNGQGFGSLGWQNNNAEDQDQSVWNVVNLFSPLYNLSAFNWQTIRGNQVEEYTMGDDTNGYVLYAIADPETGIYVSYPKFRTTLGTYISFKYGIWNGTGYERHFKVINMPILKSHLRYGVTASLKNYMGVQSEGRAIGGGLANGHATVATGGMGTLMVETGLPILNIIDAIWVNANPHPSSATGPSTAYDEASRVNVLLAGVDPVATDYWAAKNILMQTARLLGYDDVHTLDPDNRQRGSLEEAFGVWLELTQNELTRGGYNVTMNEDHMNIHVSHESPSSTDPITPSNPANSVTPSGSISSSDQTAGYGSITVILGLAAAVFLYCRWQRKKHH